MKKILLTIASLAIFLLVLTLVIAPQQGGTIPSTTLRSEELAKADPAYQETLPIQETPPGVQGRSVVIALVLLSHMLFANLHLGGAWVAAITESFGLRTREQRYMRTARSITLFNVILFSAGATFAVAAMVFFISLYPVFAGEIFHIYWWPLLAEAILFALQILFLYSYWFTWDRIGARGHQFLGYSYAVAVFFQTLMINMVASGMLSPGSPSVTWGQSGFLTMPPGDLVAWWFNATTIPLQFHRLAASVSYFGFLLALLGMVHFLDQKSAAARKYWDWIGTYGLLWGLLGLIAQPLLGFIYMRTIFDSQREAFTMIMLGARAWEMLLVVGLIAVLFIAVIAYLIDRRERILGQPENLRIQRLFHAFLVIAIGAGIILVQPAYTALGANPLGLMSYKLAALLALVVVGAVILGIDVMVLGKFRDSQWGDLSNAARLSVMTAGVIGMWIVIAMGYVRESARSPFLINGIVPVPGGQAYPTPVSIGGIFEVWTVVTAAALLVFWFTSKVTAYHPEKAEEI